ncbi:MAG: hypothetical protein E7359_00655 [Clostridiales bacterium]|nr:hypothetical protein [Clostridiales bacterium]
MKKISGILFAIVCMFSIVFSGCTYADNATLLSIYEKYSYISNKNEEFFNGQRFIPEYSSDNLLAAIYSENEDYIVLKTDNLDSVFTDRGLYGILMQSVNSTYCSTSNALHVVTNNDLTEKQYKKSMYTSLDNFQKNIKTLKKTKDSLESAFNNNSGDSSEIAEERLSLYNLEKYKDALNTSLLYLLSFNDNFTKAINNNIDQPQNLTDLLNNSSLSISVSNGNNNMLINNFNIMASKFVLNYSINVKNDIYSAEDLINTMAKLLNLQVLLPSAQLTSQEVIDEYRIIRCLEDGVLNKEVTFNNCIKVLNTNSFEKPSALETSAINSVEDIYNQLLSYGNRLIVYLQNLNA